MRTNTPAKTGEGIYEYSHLQGLMPRLGFFVGEEDRIPYDYHEILACLAPRPLLIIAPNWDQFANTKDIKQCVSQANNVYDFFNTKIDIELYVPDDYNRFSSEMQDQEVEWLKKQ